MKFKSQVTVLGLKASKGQMENGQAYDSTKAYILMDMDSSKGRMKGQSCEPFNIGDSTVFDKFDTVACPFLADAEFEIVTTGTSQKTQVVSLVPVKAATKA